MNYIKSQEGNNKNIPNVKFYVNNAVYIMRTILHTANKENLQPIIRCYHIFDFLFWEWKSELLPRLTADVTQFDDIVDLVRLQHKYFINSSHGTVQKLGLFWTHGKGVVSIVTDNSAGNIWTKRVFGWRRISLLLIISCPLQDVGFSHISPYSPVLYCVHSIVWQSFKLMDNIFGKRTWLW